MVLWSDDFSAVISSMLISEFKTNALHVKLFCTISTSLLHVYFVELDNTCSGKQYNLFGQRSGQVYAPIDIQSEVATLMPKINLHKRHLLKLQCYGAFSSLHSSLACWSYIFSLRLGNAFVSSKK